MLRELLSQWGYLAITLATFVEGEVVLMSAGALVHTGTLSLLGVVLAATIGSLAWGQVWFYVGRVFGHRAIQRRPDWRAQAAGVQAWVTRHGDWSVLAFRFAAGMAVIAPVLIGASGYSPRRFLALDASAALLWAGVFSGFGFALGAGLGKALGHDVGYVELVGIAVIGAIVVAALAQFARARSLRRKGPSAHQSTV